MGTLLFEFCNFKKKVDVRWQYGMTYDNQCSIMTVFWRHKLRKCKYFSAHSRFAINIESDYEFHIYIGLCLEQELVIARLDPLLY